MDLIWKTMNLLLVGPATMEVEGQDRSTVDNHGGIRWFRARWFATVRIVNISGSSRTNSSGWKQLLPSMTGKTKISYDTSFCAIKKFTVTLIDKLYIARVPKHEIRKWDHL